MNNMYFLNNAIANKYFERNGFKFRDGVYRIDDKVVKRIDIAKSQSIYGKFSCDELLQFNDLNIQGFSFAKALVYTKLCNVYASINQYIEGVNLDEKALGTYQIDDVITAVHGLDTAVKKISDLNIKVHDIHNGNVIFDGKKMTMIDTTEYHYEKNELQMYEENMMMIMDVLFKNIFYSAYSDSFVKCVYNVHKYFWIRGCKLANFRNFEYLMNPAETLIEMRKFMEEDFGVRLNTFSECHYYIDRIIENDSGSKVRVIKR